MPAVKVTSAGRIVQLDAKTQASNIIQPKDASDPETLAQLLSDHASDVQDLKNRFAPRHVDFEDQATGTSGAALRLIHKLGGRVRWSVVDWATSGTDLWNLKKDSTNTTADVLVLLSYVAGSATIRIEEAG